MLQNKIDSFAKSAAVRLSYGMPRITCQQFLEDNQRIAQELMGLEADHRIWWGFNRLVRDNPRVGAPGDLMNFITRSHFQAFLVGLRRQLDTDDRSVSLTRLISTVASREIIFTRSEFVARYRAEHSDHAHRVFDELCSQDGAREYPASRAFRHREWLIRQSEPIRKLVNTQIAHAARKPSAPPRIRWGGRLLQAMMHLNAHYEFVASGSRCEPNSELMIDDNAAQPLTEAWIPRGSGVQFDIRLPGRHDERC